MRVPRLPRPSPLTLLVAAVVFACGWIRWRDRDSSSGQTPVVSRLEQILGDLRFQERFALARPEPPSAAVLVAADEKSIDQVGRWPWPRAFYAKLVDQLTQAGAAAIVFDVAFNDRYAGEGTEDDALAAAIRRSGKTVQAMVLLGNGEVEHLTPRQREEHLGRVIAGALAEPMARGDAPGTLLPLHHPVSAVAYPAVDPPLPEIAAAGRWVGYYNASPDSDGVLRSEPLFARVSDRFYFPSIDLAGAALACGDETPRFVTPVAPGPAAGYPSEVQIACAGRTLAIPVSKDGRLSVNFPVPWRQYPMRSAVDVARGDFPPAWVRGKAAVVAATAEGTHDLRNTPLDKDVPGGVVHVAAIDQMLRGRFLSRPAWAAGLELLVLAAFGAGFGALFASLSAPWALAALAGGIAGWHVLAYAFFAAGLDVFAALPIVELVALFLVAIPYRYFGEEREKRFIREAFRFYLTPSVMDAVLADPSRLKLGGEKRELTVLFSDIRGFTSLSEKLAPEQLVQLLNEYLTPMTDIVFENGGTLDKYMGDAIMAFFGAPIEQPDHALRACRTAVRMLERLDALERSWLAAGLPEIDIGIGINTGPMVVGNMGSHSRFDYTVMGDAVNLGSRLEGTNKLYGTRAIVSESTLAQVKGQVVARELDAVVVKGKHQPVRIYELIAVGEPPRAWIEMGGPELLAAYERALLAYRARRLDEALDLLGPIRQRWPADQPARHLEERCEAAKKEPPDAEWSGISKLATK